MKPELNELLISEKEFQEITGISIDEVNEIAIYQEKIFIHKFRKIAINFLKDFSISLLAISIVLAIILWILSQIFSSLFAAVEVSSFASALRTAAYFSLPISLLLSLKLHYGKLGKLQTKNKYLKHLTILFNEFKKHNQIVKAIDVKDQLESLEQKESDPQIKLTLLKSLVEMREDLIKALKIEKILRENRTVVETNPELFQSSFNATKVQKIIDRGSEYDRLINKTLKLGAEVTKEVKKMQSNSELESEQKVKTNE